MLFGDNGCDSKPIPINFELQRFLSLPLGPSMGLHFIANEQYMMLCQQGLGSILKCILK